MRTWREVVFPTPGFPEPETRFFGCFLLPETRFFSISKAGYFEKPEIAVACKYY